MTTTTSVLSLLLPPEVIHVGSVARTLGERAGREVGSPIEVLITTVADGVLGATGGALRNAGVAASTGTLIAFVGDDQAVDGEFLEEARRLLDADERLDLVTGFGDRVPAALGGAPRPLDEITLLARPLAAQVPTVFRRKIWAGLGGFDETLPAGEEPDFWLRAIDAGVRGVVVEARLPSGRGWVRDVAGPAEAAEDARWAPFFARHAARLARVGSAALLAKERMFRELERRAAEVHAERRALDGRRAALEALEAQVARLERAAR